MAENETEKTILIDGEHLTAEDVWKVSKKLVACKLPTEENFWDTIKRARAFLIDYIKTGVPTYGVTTDFGDSCANQISFEKAGELQRVIVRYHGIGLGEPFSAEEGRAVIACRLNSNAKGGYSAVRSELLKAMEALLAHDIIPVIPQLGSVGASGDLTPLSYLAAVLMGEREVYYKGKVCPAFDALKAEGLAPILLEAKEGLALMNGTSVMSAVASIAIHNAKRLAKISDYLSAVTSEIVRGKDTPFFHNTNKIKNHNGQIQSAKNIRAMQEGSKRVFWYEDFLKSQIASLEGKGFRVQENKIQDRYSIRCAPQVTGVLRDTLQFCEQWVCEELNSANDNPLVDLESERLLNTGNFYGGHICAACDYLRVAIANISDLADKQAEVIIDGKFNGLTENLIPRISDTDESAGLHLGFKGAQITISAIRGEVQSLCAPISITSSPTEALNQDKVSMGTISARKLRDQIDLVYLQFAVHILAAMQAVDLAGEEDFSPFTKEVHKAVRKMSKVVSEDRPLDQDAQKVAQWLKETKLFCGEE